MPSEQLRAANSDAGGYNGSSEDASAADGIVEPEYIYVQSIGSDGAWHDEYRISYSEAKALMTSANQEAGSQSLEVVQSIATSNQEYQTIAMTFSIVLAFGLFAVIGVNAVQTLIRSFEVR